MEGLASASANSLLHWPVPLGYGRLPGGGKLQWNGLFLRQFAHHSAHPNGAIQWAGQALRGLAAVAAGMNRASARALAYAECQTLSSMKPGAGEGGRENQSRAWPGAVGMLA